MSKVRGIDGIRLGILALVAVSAVLVLTQSRWRWIFDEDAATTTGVEAPTLEPLEGVEERLFRISPDTGSSVTYDVTEVLAGNETTSRGTTTVLGGDIGVNVADPSASRMTEIVVNVEMFDSDSSLRDKRIRHDFLESTHFPFATFTADSIELDDVIADGDAESNVTMAGTLTLKDIAAPVTFSGTASIEDDTLTASVSGTVLMSTYGIGPIHVAGLAHTEDEVRFELEIVAAEVEDGPTPDADSLAILPEDPAPTVGEFAATVQPILESGCASCHVEGGPGHATVALDTAGDAAAIAEDIAFVTGLGFMPPWPASDLSLEFHDDYSLDPSEIEAIAAWADAGGGLDVPADTPLEPDEPVYEPIERDLVVPARDGAYVGSLDQKDDYRCIIHEIDDPEGDGTWIKGIGYEPDQLTVNHHSIIYLVPAEGREEAESLNGSDGRTGWECFGRSGMRTPGVTSIGGWAPGQQPAVYPDGVAMFFPPGSFIVNQIHYHFDHETPPDRSSLVFDTLSNEEVAALEEPLTIPAGRSYLTPAEGPCTPAEEGPLCDRTAVLADIASKYGDEAALIPGFINSRCGGTHEDYNELDGTKFSSSCDLEARDFGTLRSVLGHMHEFGDSYRMTLNPDTPEERILLDIPRWSFEWQMYYVPTEQIRIEPGDVFRFECTWDRRNATMPEPRYITWNEGTVDEMCFSSVGVVPDLNVEGEPNGYYTGDDN